MNKYKQKGYKKNMKITNIFFDKIEINKDQKIESKIINKYQIKDLAWCILTLDEMLVLRRIKIRQQRLGDKTILFVLFPYWKDKNCYKYDYYYFTNINKSQIKNKVKNLILEKYHLFINNQENNFKVEMELKI